jgi:hypothetical protein
MISPLSDALMKKFSLNRVLKHGSFGQAFFDLWTYASIGPKAYASTGAAADFEYLKSPI